MMDQGTVVKGGRVSKLCCLVCVIVNVVVVTVVVSLLAVIQYEVQNQHGSASNDCCEKSIEYQLAEDQTMFLEQIRDLCSAICNARFQSTEVASELPRLIFFDPTAEVFRCLACCQQLEEAQCTNLVGQGYENYCTWVNSGNSSACVGISFSPQPD